LIDRIGVGDEEGLTLLISADVAVERLETVIERDYLEARPAGDRGRKVGSDPISM